MAIRKTIFHNGAAGDLPVRFSRNVPTIDRQLAIRSANQMRIGPDVAVIDRPAWTSRGTIAADGSTWTILCAGYDADGVTPLSVVYTLSNGGLKVYSGSAFTLLRTIDTLTTDGLDLLKGKSNVKANYRHRPVCGTICHGIIILGCEVLHDQTDGVGGTRNFQKEFEAFLYSTDKGVSWNFVQFAGADYPTPITGSLGRSRLARWALQNYFPSPAKASPVLDAWIAATDYLQNTGSPGGQGYLFKISRTNPTGSGWTVSAGITVPGTRILETERHAHGAAVLEFGAELHYVIVYGDGLPAEIVRCVCSDKAAFTNLANWTTYRGAFGDASSASTSRGPNQVVGFAPGPTADTFLATQDTQYGSVSLWTAVADPSVQLDCKILFNRTQGIQNGCECLHIHANKPEINGGWLTYSAPQSSGTYPHMQGNLYSADGRNFAELRSNMNRVAWFHGSDIWSPLTVSGTTTIDACPTPSMFIVRRPVMVAPGGQNNFHDPGYFAGGVFNGYTVTACPKDGSGRFLWPAGAPLAGALIDPQPPSKGQMWYVVTDPTHGATDGSIFDFLTFKANTNIAGPNAATRLWVMGLEKCAIDFGLLAGYSGWTFAGPSMPISVVANDQWLAYPWSKNFNSNTNFQLEAFFATPALRLQKALVCMDVVTSGAFLSYPLDMQTTGAHEKLAVTSLGCGPAWTVNIIAQVPGDSWDQWLLGNCLASWTLFTVWGDANNFVEIQMVKGAAADATGSLRARVVVGGAQVAAIDLAGYWASKGSQVAVSLAQSSALGGIQFSGTVSGDTIGTGSAAFSLATMPNEVRFSNADESLVCPIFPLAVLVDASNAYDAAARATALRGKALASGTGRFPAYPAGTVIL